jgi:cytochrome c
MVRNSDYKYIAVVFVLIYIVLTFIILNDQMSFASAISDQMKQDIAKSEELEKEVKSKTLTTSGVDADAIFNSKCIACHRFDVKLVGPPYQQTVPKYNGDINALAEFIYNPVKKNPDFPPMPNQGLKKKEAQAMAKWLIEKVGGKK